MQAYNYMKNMRRNLLFKHAEVLRITLQASQ